MGYSQFYDQIYQLVAQIPSGKVATYGQIAAMLGKPLAARQVGEAMRRTPEYLDIPTHRVVNRAGEMAPGYAFGGAARQRGRLEAEGVVFSEAGCIDLEKCRWQP